MDLRGDRVDVVGIVDDLRPEIERAAIVIAPLRIGGGTRLKILEAMAFGKPVVTTTIGAEGIDVTHEREVLVADSPAEFALAFGRIYDDAALGARLGSAARQKAEARYSWRAAARDLTDFYRKTMLAAPRV
jgi:glycosyltransferase involved in cell wall biosynthesis